ncbi:glycoside hydrolase family 2 TIM barrel-domain containing protein [Candidatus Cloacimonadota bacterium]
MFGIGKCKLFGILILFFLITATVSGQAVPVDLVQTTAGGWQLLRDGIPYYIKGAGGDGSKELLAASGANTFRTWGVGPDLGEQLDEAYKLGLSVVVGHWLGHTRHGFSYQDSLAVKEQFDKVLNDVITYKDHPAVLLWGIGNEMEGFAEGDDPAVWNHVQDLAAMIKEIDPFHPTMTVTAEIGGERVRSVHDLCPDIDIMGINSYGGLPSVPQRYREQGGAKPVIITEFGPPGVWETRKTEYGAPPELTSTEKAEFYINSFTAGCLDFEELCLGGFAFTWGSKLEVTATWYGMFLPDGSKLAAVDVMTELWSGELPENLCPEIRKFEIIGTDIRHPDAEMEVILDVVDPEGEELKVNWSLFQEAPEYLIGEQTQWTPLELDGIITSSSSQKAVMSMPGGGVYRLFITARDGAGGAAVANIPFIVEGEEGDVKYKLPVYVYSDEAPQPWFYSGWMGNHQEMEIDPTSKVSPYSGETCFKVKYKAAGDWTGIAWQHPANDWGYKPGGYDLTGAKKLTFWARGEFGNEIVSFGLGLLGSDKEFHDTASGEIKDIKLKQKWTKYTIDLKNKDLSRIKTPFIFSLVGQRQSVTFYLDDIRFE